MIPDFIFQALNIQRGQRDVEADRQEQFADDPEALMEFGRVILELEHQVRRIIDDAAQVQTAVQQRTVRL